MNYVDPTGHIRVAVPGSDYGSSGSSSGSSGSSGGSGSGGSTGGSTSGSGSGSPGSTGSGTSSSGGSHHHDHNPNPNPQPTTAQIEAQDQKTLATEAPAIAGVSIASAGINLYGEQQSSLFGNLSESYLGNTGSNTEITGFNSTFIAESPSVTGLGNILSDGWDVLQDGFDLSPWGVAVNLGINIVTQSTTLGSATIQQISLNKYPWDLLPTKGSFPYVPPKDKAGNPILNLGKIGLKDKKGNQWKLDKGSVKVGNTHWDVTTPNGKHVNVNPKGTPNEGEVNHGGK